jgi:hypothetical protein
MTTDPPDRAVATILPTPSIETARQLECDKDKEWLEEKLKRIAGAKPKPGKKD